MTASPRFIPSAFTPTDEQREIQTAGERVILVEANAGAAKTTTLALRIGESLARGVPAAGMLALVFTEEAREVMRRRLVEVGIAPALTAAVRVETFESLAQAVLLEYEGFAVPSATVPQLREQVLAALDRVSAKYQYRYSGLEIATHNLAVSQFLDLQMAVKARLAYPEDADLLGHEETAEVMGLSLTHLLTFLEYEELRLGVFGEAKFRGPFDATYDLARSLGERPEIADFLPTCQLVVCDELHDMNEAAFRILLALLDKGNTRGKAYFVGAGDKDQVIHATLGADAQYLRERFDHAFPALRRLPLSATYRHGAHLALSMGKFKNKPSQSGLTTVTDIPRLTYPAGDWTQGGELVVKALRLWKKEGGALGDCAILLRDSHQSIAIENALITAGIAYHCHALMPYLQRPEILFLRGMLAIALGDLATVAAKDIRKAIVEALVTFGELDLKASLYLPGVGTPASAEQALAWAQQTVADAPDTLQSFFTGLIVGKEGEKLSPARQRIVASVDYLRGLAGDAPAAEVFVEIWARLGLEAAIKRLYVYPQEAEVVIRSAQGFIELARSSGLSLADFSASIGEREATVGKSRGKKGVTVELVATAKGKEYEHVILPFLEQGEFPQAGAASADESNLFYVGATRARARLTLIVPDAPERQSVFIERMGLGSALAAKAETAREKLADAQAAVAINALARAGKANGTKPSPRIASQRTDLKVSYAEKDKAKALGARWDATRRTWYIETGTELAPFREWLI